MYTDVKLSTLYDVLQDPVYRKTWDPNILEGQEICRINATNDIGYYASTRSKGFFFKINCLLSLCICVAWLYRVRRLSTVADRAFPTAASRIWNSLPLYIACFCSAAVSRPNLLFPVTDATLFSA